MLAGPFEIFSILRSTVNNAWVLNRRPGAAFQMVALPGCRGVRFAAEGSILLNEQKTCSLIAVCFIFGVKKGFEILVGLDCGCPTPSGIGIVDFTTALSS